MADKTNWPATTLSLQFTGACRQVNTRLERVYGFAFMLSDTEAPIEIQGGVVDYKFRGGSDAFAAWCGMGAGLRRLRSVLLASPVALNEPGWSAELYETLQRPWALRIESDCTTVLQMLVSGQPKRLPTELAPCHKACHEILKSLKEDLLLQPYRPENWSVRHIHTEDCLQPWGKVREVLQALKAPKYSKTEGR